MSMMQARDFEIVSKADFECWWRRNSNYYSNNKSWPIQLHPFTKKFPETKKRATIEEKKKPSSFCESSLWTSVPILTINNSEKHSFLEKSAQWDPQSLKQSTAIVAPSQQRWGLHGFAVSNGCSEKQLSDCNLRRRDKRVFNLHRGLL